MSPSLPASVSPPATSAGARALLDAVSDAVMIVDAAGRLVWRNEPAARWLARYGPAAEAADGVPTAADALAVLPLTPEGRASVRAAAERVRARGGQEELFPAVAGRTGTVPLRVVDAGDDRVAVIWRRRGGDAPWLPSESVPLLHELVVVFEEAPAEDDDLRIVFVNEAFEHFTGWSRHDVLGRSPTLLDGPATDHGVRARLREQLADGERARTELVQYRRDGTPYWAEMEVVPRTNAMGERTHWVAVQRDIGERKRLEEQLFQSQKMEAVGRLAGGIAHDFNNVLTAISGFSELLLEDLPADLPAREEVRQIRAAADRASALTRQLLAFSRRQILRPRATRMPALVGDMAQLLQRAAGEAVQLRVVVPDVAAPVLADPTQLEQVVLNLVVNAAEAMPDGGDITVEVSEVALDSSHAMRHHGLQPGHYVCLAVSDSGVGMDRDTRERIFEPFFTTKSGGTGLGLSTVYGIVRQSGGHVWVYSEPGSGTTFKVYLPVTSAAATEPADPGASDGALRGTETVLVVEDEDLVRQVACAMLRRRGYTVLAASDGEAAMEVARYHPGRIDLLLTDVVMPKANGRRVAELLQVQQPGIRVLYMSGYTQDAIVHHGVLDEGITLLEKPFSDVSLARRVRGVLDAAPAAASDGT